MKLCAVSLLTPAMVLPPLAVSIAGGAMVLAQSHQ
jgi:hypothetical protein